MKILIIILFLLYSTGIDKGFSEVSFLQKQIYLEQETKCLASVIWHEARGESLQGQLAVAQVVKNRVKSKHYPNTICKVVFQPHQFSGLTKIKYDKNTFLIAKKFIEGKLKSPIKNATHYHANYVNPYWASSEKIIFSGVIGKHIFYKAIWA